MDKVTRIKSTHNVLSLAQQYGLQLKRKGHDYTCRCPFHQEKTPSFFIFAGGERFKCFGCDAKGDVINFYALYNNTDNASAIRQLAIGIPDNAPIKPPAPTEDKQEIAHSKESRKWALDIFHGGKPLQDCHDNQLPIWKYLKRRSIDIYDRRRFIHPALRFRKDLRLHRDIGNGSAPTLIAGFIKEEDGQNKVVAISRIYMKQDGTKYATEEGRNKFTLSSYHGAIIPCWLGMDEFRNPLPPINKNPDNQTEEKTLLLTEGVEDALAIASLYPYHRIAAAGGLSSMQNIIIPAGFDKVILAADEPKTVEQQDLMNKAIDNFAAQGKEYGIAYPPDGHKDFNDFIIAEEAKNRGSYGKTS